jgi:hypothetical protein
MKRASRSEWRSAAAKRLQKLGGTSCIDEAVCNVVARVLDDYQCAPIDLNAVMNKLNVVGVETDDQLIVAGELRKEKDKLKIYLAPGLPKGRRRFTIAHELGHAFFESTGPGCPRVGNELEALCNKIAAELLMPTHIFKRAVGSNPTIDSLLKLASDFEVSTSALFLRAAKLYKCCSFGVDDGAIHWTAGLAKHRFAGASSSLRRGIECAMRGEAGSDLVDINAGQSFTRWQMEWRPLGGSKQAVFLLKP